MKKENKTKTVYCNVAVSLSMCNYVLIHFNVV